MKLQRPLVLLVALGIALAALNLWAWFALDQQRRYADNAEHDANACRQLAEQIKRLKVRPMIAGSHEIELTELSKRIEQAAIACQIPSASLVRISPESARRAGDSLYLEKPTTVLLEGVSLHQLTRFLYTMSSGPAAMDVPALRINAPRDQETGDHWTAEVTFSYLIYAPKQDENGPLNQTSDGKGRL